MRIMQQNKLKKNGEKGTETPRMCSFKRESIQGGDKERLCTKD